MPEYVDILRLAFADMWASALLNLPRIGVAVIILIVGFILANVLKTAVLRGVRLLKVDELLEQLEIKKMIEKTGLTIDTGEILAFLVKWVVVIMALIASADILEWHQITVFLSAVVGYIPNVLIAVVILIVGVMVANLLENLIRSALTATKMKSAGFASGIAKWSLLVFSFMAALIQLGIARELIQTLFTGFVAMVALAGGLAFGLGGRDHAKKVLEYLEKDLKEGK